MRCRIWWTIVSGVVMAAWALPAHAEECAAASGHQVHVQGSAVLRLPPDRVSFSVGVETTHAKVSQAFRANAQKVAAVLDALKARGVRPAEVQTSNLEVASRDSDGTRTNGYRVTNHVTVSREDVWSVGDLLEAAVAAGANDAGALRFFLADPGREQGRGLELAFASARAKAETLAKLTNQTLGDVVCVTETYPRDYSGMNYSRGPEFATMTVVPGTGVLSYAVDVVFALK